MSVHAVEIVCSKNQESSPSTVPTPEPPELYSVVDDRVSQNVFDTFTEVLTGQKDKAGLVKATSITSFDVDHTRGRYRVDSAEDKKALLDAIESNTVTDAKWYEIRYHSCDHDESAENRTGCGDWKTERTKGTIPNGV